MVAPVPSSCQQLIAPSTLMNTGIGSMTYPLPADCASASDAGASKAHPDPSLYPNPTSGPLMHSTAVLHTPPSYVMPNTAPAVASTKAVGGSALQEQQLDCWGPLLSLEADMPPSELAAAGPSSLPHLALIGYNCNTLIPNQLLEAEPAVASAASTPVFGSPLSWPALNSTPAAPSSGTPGFSYRWQLKFYATGGSGGAGYVSGDPGSRIGVWPSWPGSSGSSRRRLNGSDVILEDPGEGQDDDSDPEAEAPAQEQAQQGCGSHHMGMCPGDSQDPGQGCWQAQGGQAGDPAPPVEEAAAKTSKDGVVRRLLSRLSSKRGKPRRQGRGGGSGSAAGDKQAGADA